MCADCHLPGTLCMWTDCTTCFEGCATTAGECGGCLGGAGEAGLPLLLIMGVIVLGLFTVIGIFYSVLVATMVGQRIWQRHYHILAKRMLTKVSTAVNSSTSISTMVLLKSHLVFSRNMLKRMSMASAQIGVRRHSLQSTSTSWSLWGFYNSSHHHVNGRWCWP